MKQFLSLLLLFAGASLCAQNCESYWYLTNNAEVQMTIYNAKGKESGKQTWKVTGVKQNGSGFVANVTSSFTDEKGKELAKGAGTYQCDGGMLKSDIRMTMPQQQAQMFQDAEANLEPTYIEYPYNMSEGQSLKDAVFEMDMKMNSGMNSKMSMKQTNRKVEGKEQVTSPAGTWEAYKITSEGYYRMNMGGIGIPMTFKVTEWFVPGFGIVKTESYNKNGKFMGSTLLTSLKK